MLGAGVSSSVCWAGDTPVVPLPCREVDFMQQTVTPDPVYLDLEDTQSLAQLPVLPDVRQQSIRLIFLRKRILEYVRIPVLRCIQRLLR
jgi:hypothetical protein